MIIVDKKQKETLIIDAAIKSFSLKGYEKSSISDIAKYADIATGSIYRYFKNKQTLFHKSCIYIFNKYIKGFESSLSNENRIYSAIDFSLKFFKENSNYAKILMMEARNFSIRFPEYNILNIWHFKISELLIEKLKDELPALKKEVNHQFYISLMLGGIESIIMNWLFNPQLIDMSEKDIVIQLTKIIKGEK